MDTTPSGEVKPGTQHAALLTAGAAALALFACWGLASMTPSLAIYAAGWVAAVSAASAAALVYRIWTAGRPDLQQQTQTMTLGLVGWLIVIGGGMTLFRAAASVFVEAELGNLNLATWLLPIALLLSVAAWGLCWRGAGTYADERLRAHAPQHLATVAALALAEAGLILTQLGDEVVRWPDVLAGVVVIAVGMAWSWLRLWKRIASSSATPDPAADNVGDIDPAISTQARAILDTARDNSDIQNYDRLAIENDAAGTHITVRLHLGADLPLRAARERGRTLERALEALLPAGSATALLEPAAATNARPAPPPPTPTPAPHEKLAPPTDSTPPPSQPPSSDPAPQDTDEDGAVSP